MAMRNELDISALRSVYAKEKADVGKKAEKTVRNVLWSLMCYGMFTTLSLQAGGIIAWEWYWLMAPVWTFLAVGFFVALGKAAHELDSMGP